MSSGKLNSIMDGLCISLGGFDEDIDYLFSNSELYEKDVENKTDKHVKPKVNNTTIINKFNIAKTYVGYTNDEVLDTAVYIEEDSLDGLSFDEEPVSTVSIMETTPIIEDNNNSSIVEDTNDYADTDDTNYDTDDNDDISIEEDIEDSDDIDIEDSDEFDVDDIDIEDEDEFDIEEDEFDIEEDEIEIEDEEETVATNNITTNNVMNRYNKRDDDIEIEDEESDEPEFDLDEDEDKDEDETEFSEGDIEFDLDEDDESEDMDEETNIQPINSTVKTNDTKVVTNTEKTAKEDKIKEYKNELKTTLKNNEELEAMQKEMAAMKERLRELESETNKNTSNSNIKNNFNLDEKIEKQIDTIKIANNTNKYLRYEQLPTDILYKEVKNYMIKLNVRNRPVDISLLNEKFGEKNIKKLINKAYLIKFGKGVTAGR